MVDDPNSDKSTRQDVHRQWAVQGYIVRYPNQRFSPPTDIIETENRIVILVEIAGMSGDGFKIALHNQSLMISGTRERPDYQDAAYHQAEIGFGDFRLTVPIPWSVDQEHVTASYTNGFLRIELPRQKARRVHIVDVNNES